MAGTWFFLLLCDVCERRSEAMVPEADLRRLSSGGFAPLPCPACGAWSARPTVRPWDLSLPDRKLLRSMHITATT